MQDPAELEGIPESVTVHVDPQPPEAPKPTEAKPEAKGGPLWMLPLSLLLVTLCFGAALLSCKHKINDLEAKQEDTVEAMMKLAQDLRTKALVPAQGFATIPSDLAAYSVRIRVQDGIRGDRSFGSGVLISKNYIVTNYHVVQLGLMTKTVWVDFANADGTSKAVVAVIDVVDAARDIAFIKLPEGVSANRWAKLAAKPLPPHSPIVAIACGNNHLPLAKSGYFGYRMSDGRFELSISGFWGDSGGPVFNPATGELVCLYNEMDRPHVDMTTGTAVFATSIFASIPASWIAEVMKANNIEN
jgi:hypothetical protein